MSHAARVADRVDGSLTLRHDLKNPQGRNSVNNTTFALRGTRIVEVVRQGRKNSRVRPDLNGNGRTYLVPSKDLKGITSFAERAC